MPCEGLVLGRLWLAGHVYSSGLMKSWLDFPIDKASLKTCYVTAHVLGLVNSKCHILTILRYSFYLTFNIFEVGMYFRIAIFLRARQQSSRLPFKNAKSPVFLIAGTMTLCKNMLLLTLNIDNYVWCQLGY